LPSVSPTEVDIGDETFLTSPERTQELIEMVYEADECLIILFGHSLRLLSAALAARRL